MKLEWNVQLHMRMKYENSRSVRNRLEALQIDLEPHREILMSRFNLEYSVNKRNLLP